MPGLEFFGSGVFVLSSELSFDRGFGWFSRAFCVCGVLLAFGAVCVIRMLLLVRGHGGVFGSENCRLRWPGKVL